MSDKSEFNLVTLDRDIADLAKKAKVAEDSGASAEEVGQKYNKLLQAIIQRQNLTVEAAKLVIPAVIKHFTDK